MTNDIPTIFCAIDTADIKKASKLAKQISSEKCGIKLGLEFFNSHGPQGIKQISSNHPNVPIFLDLKYHDIPNTVAKSLEAIANLEVNFVNMHCAGGYEMMETASNAIRNKCKNENLQCPKLLGVTIITSLDQNAINEIGYANNIKDQVVIMAKLAKKAGLDGVVCSSHEIEIIKDACGGDFITMVPGIRPKGSTTNDQKRVMTPPEAIQAGAHYLVIGRPITQSENIANTICEINKSITDAN